MSKQKKAILRVLRDTTSHPTGGWIYNEVRKEIPDISLGTVYRNLKVLRKKGEILELEYGNTFRRFDGNRHKNYHFRCEKCGRVFNVDEPIDGDIDESVA
ncbi:MAG: transcriptional repressor [Chloroflexota bacterium]|nr:transcriptional repressor [Chloroflexota bacterium]